MSNALWVRLWLDMPTDPKFRVVAKKAGRPLPEVIALFSYMLTFAGRRLEDRTQANASERGELFGWSHDDAAAALDMEASAVEAIYSAMQGKVLDGATLTGWEKRQPLREDGSAERARAWRERKRTQANARERPETETETETDNCSEDAAREPAPKRQAPRTEQGLKNGLAKGGGGLERTRQRAEGLGLDVAEIDAATARARPRDPTAYFRTLCVNRLQPKLPTIPAHVIAGALSGDRPAFTVVCAALMGPGT